MTFALMFAYTDLTPGPHRSARCECVNLKTPQVTRITPLRVKSYHVCQTQHSPKVFHHQNYEFLLTETMSRSFIGRNTPIAQAFPRVTATRTRDLTRSYIVHHLGALRHRTPERSRCAAEKYPVSSSGMRICSVVAEAFPCGPGMSSDINPPKRRSRLSCEVQPQHHVKPPRIFGIK